MPAHTIRQLTAPKLPAVLLPFPEMTETSKSFVNSLTKQKHFKFGWVFPVNSLLVPSGFVQTAVSWDSSLVPS